MLDGSSHAAFLDVLTFYLGPLHRERLCGERSGDEQIALFEELRLNAVFAVITEVTTEVGRDQTLG